MVVNINCHFYSCYHYYTIYWLKNINYHINIKMNSAKEIDIVNRAHYFLDDMIYIKNFDLDKTKIYEK